MELEELAEAIRDLMEDVASRVPIEDRTEYTKGFLDGLDYILDMVEEEL